MTGTFIASTPKASMHALAYQGIMVCECFPQLRDMLRRKFGDDYVLLFAEPVFNQTEGSVDWYTPVQGTVQQLGDLQQQEQNTIRSTLMRMGNEIRRFAEELKQSPDALKLTRGNLLELALSFPDDSSLYVVGGQPVFVCWGFGPGTPGVEAQSLCRLSTGEVTPASVPQVVPQPAPPAVLPAPSPAPLRRGTWWWLLPFFLLLLLILLLFSSFGTLPAVSGRALLHLPALFFFTQSDALTQAERRNGELEIQLNALNEKVRTHIDACIPPSTSPRAPSVQVIPLPPVASTKTEPQQDLHIPDNPGNLDFIRGGWRCDTGLENTRTHEPVAFEFSFDEKGKGQGVVHEKNDICTGEAEASLKDDMLHITLMPQQCRNSKTSYDELLIICHNVSGRGTMCKGTNKDGSTWDAYFNKNR